MKCLGLAVLSVCLGVEAQEPSFEQRIADLDAKATLLEKRLKENAGQVRRDNSFREQAKARLDALQARLEALPVNQPPLEPIPKLPESVPTEALLPALEIPVPVPAPQPVPAPFSPSPDHAQDPDAPGDLSLSQALVLARANTENFAAFQARLESVRARFQAVGAMPAPELRLRHDDGRLGGESTQEYALRFRFNNPWETKAQREEVQARTKAARFQLQLAERLLATEVTALYFKTLFRQGDASYAREISEAQLAIRSIHETLFDAGQLTLPKVLESRLDASRKTTEATEAEHDAEHAAATLLAYLNLPENQFLNLVTPFAQPNANASALRLKNLVPIATHGRPELLTLESESDAARARVRLAEARHMPWFSFAQASFEQDRGISADADQWGVLLGIDFPFWGRQADLQASSAELHETLTLQRLALRDVRLALDGARRDYQVAKQRLVEREASLSKLERELVPALRETRVGQGIDPLSRNRLRMGLLEARRELFQARYQYQSARLALEDALGHPLEQGVPAKEK